MIRVRHAPLLALIVALCANLACSDEASAPVANTAADDAGDVGYVDDTTQYDGGASDTDDNDVVEEPDEDVAPADDQVDPDEWEELDLDDADISHDYDLLIGPADRPARVLLPDSYDESQPMPAVFLFHGYTATSALQDAYFNLSPRRHDREFIAVLPDGLTNPTGQQYWNATDYCCDFYDEQTDDVGYVMDLVDELIDQVAVDPERIHLMGHSNGHFFSNRLACDHGSQFASVVGYGGSGHWDEADCPVDGSVSMLHIHGTSDAVILYGGALGLYPGARTMVDRWADRNDCSSDSSIYGSVSLAALIWGNETTQRRFDGCPEGVDVELWSIIGGTHASIFESDFSDRILDFALPRTNRDSQ